MTAVAKLWKEGKLKLDSPIQEYVPSFPEKMYDGKPVRIPVDSPLPGAAPSVRNDLATKRKDSSTSVVGVRLKSFKFFQAVLTVRQLTFHLGGIRHYKNAKDMDADIGIDSEVSPTLRSSRIRPRYLSCLSHPIASTVPPLPAYA